MITFHCVIQPIAFGAMTDAHFGQHRTIVGSSTSYSSKEYEVQALRPQNGGWGELPQQLIKGRKNVD